MEIIFERYSVANLVKGDPLRQAQILQNAGDFALPRFVGNSCRQPDHSHMEDSFAAIDGMSVQASRQAMKAMGQFCALMYDMCGLAHFGLTKDNLTKPQDKHIGISGWNHVQPADTRTSAERMFATLFADTKFGSYAHVAVHEFELITKRKLNAETMAYMIKDDKLAPAIKESALSCVRKWRDWSPACQLKLAA